MKDREYHQALRDEGYLATNDAYEAEIYHDAVVLGFPFDISQRDDGTHFVDLTPHAHALDEQMKQAGDIWQREITSSLFEG